MSTIATRAASPDDAALLASLHAQCFDEAWDETAFDAFLRDPLTFALIVGAEDAFILVRVAADESEILSLGTRPDVRRSGLARALVRAAAIEAQRRAAERMFLEVAADNEAALTLYQVEGFRPVGHRPGYYVNADGAIVDAVILSAALPF
jgi:[ribosomal protein S18]-alanine N-acetyltransferase